MPQLCSSYGMARPGWPMAMPVGLERQPSAALTLATQWSNQVRLTLTLTLTLTLARTLTITITGTRTRTCRQP